MVEERVRTEVSNRDRRGDVASRMLPLFETPHVRERDMAPPSVSVVIPAFNEAENLYFVLPLIPRDVKEVILVDGSSTDDTVDVARRLRSDVRIVRQTGKGKGDALVAGFQAATGEIIVMLDADGSADPTEIPRFVDALSRAAHFAKGTRFAEGGGSADITRVRRAGNWVLMRIVNLLFRTSYTDLCYGYNAFWSDCLPALSVDRCGFEVETLINIRAALAGLTVTEVPSYEHARITGVSNLNAARDGARVMWTIVKERIRSTRRDRGATALAKRWPAKTQAMGEDVTGP
jgi:glycosyltransferase involved in cell wall biosynthesis